MVGGVHKVILLQKPWAKSSVYDCLVLFSQTRFRWRQEANPTAAAAALEANTSSSSVADWAIDDVYVGEQCPLLCSGRGDCVRGSCLCDDGYFGKLIPLSLSLSLSLYDRKNNKYQLSLTNPRDALRHGKRAANKGGRSV